MTKKLNAASDDRPTSNGEVYCSDPKLFPIAKRSKELPKEKFCNLLHHMNEERVLKVIAKIKKNSASGPDEISQPLAEDHADWIVPKILDDIHKKSYEAPASKRVYIPKSSGGKRPLGIGNIVDRGVQGAAREILEHIYEQDFMNSSFGFRPGRSAHNALCTLNHTVMNEGKNYLLEVDLENFFGTINHGWLMKFLGHRISDQRMLNLIESWLKAGVMEDGRFYKNEVGTAQGGAISPLLANLYLHYVLDLWFEKLIKPRLMEGSGLIRYADDFIVAFKNKEDRSDFVKLLKVRLDQFGLKISEKKTHETDLEGPDKKGTKRRHAAFLGFKIFKTKTKSGKGSKLVFKTDSAKLSSALNALKDGLRRRMHAPIQVQVNYLNSVIRGHCNYYGMAGNSKSLSCFYFYVMKYWRRALSRRSQAGCTSWEKMNKHLKKYKVANSRLKIPYTELSKYVIL